MKRPRLKWSPFPSLLKGRCKMNEAALKTKAEGRGLNPVLVAFLLSMAKKYGPIALQYLLDLLDQWAQPAVLGSAPAKCADHKADCDQAKASSQRALAAVGATLADAPDCTKHQAAFECCLCACCCCECCCESCPA